MADLIRAADFNNADPTPDPDTWTVDGMRAAITHLARRPVDLTRRGLKRPIVERQVQLVDAYLYMGRERVTMEWQRNGEPHRTSVHLDEVLSIELAADRG
ncbi:hypothetical protein ACGFIW_01505 [Micromonospora sp. NPDC048935]|uniref:hypothetical protein n=1 Tax=Micromonospora sp. NPDC048935 TaxID=3364262 RepID=UPI0037155832